MTCSILKITGITSIDFSCGCASPKLNSNDFTLDCANTGTAFSPMNAYIDNHIRCIFTNEYRLTCYTGSSGTFDLSTRPAAIIPAAAYTGLDYYMNLAIIETLYPVGFSAGFSSTVALTTVPAITFIENSTIGSLFSVNLQTSAGFIEQSDFGSSASLILTDAPKVGYQCSAYTGQTSSSELSRTVRLDSSTFYGQYCNFELSTRYSYYPIATYGQDAVEILTPNPPWNPNVAVFYGQSSSSNLTTTSNFVESAVIGQTLDVNITLDPAYQVISNATFGSSAVISNLVVRSSVPSAGYLGSSGILSLSTFPAAAQILTSYYGSSGNVDLALTQQVGLTKGYFGSNGLISNIVNIDNWYVYNGNSANLELSTATQLDFNGRFGSDSLLNLTYGVSEPIGSFAAGVDTNAQVKLSTMRSYTFTMSAGMGLYYHDNNISQFWLDLNYNSCCPILPRINDLTHIELNDEPGFDVKYGIGGFNASATMIFTTQPRFKISTSYGEEMSLIDHSYHMSFAGGFGTTSKARDLYFPLNIELGLGNFVPAGDHISVELAAPLPRNVYGQAAYTGASANVNLSTQTHVDMANYIGFSSTNEIVTTGPISFVGYFGATLTVNLNTTVIMSGDSFIGSAAKSNFYEQPIITSFGATSIVSLTTTYDVEFIERGPLPNEYIIVNENGDPIPNPSQGSVIEGQQYTHFIKGECF